MSKTILQQMNLLSNSQMDAESV